MDEDTTAADLQLEEELTAGWRARFERDPADPRFVTFTSRHPYPLAEELPPGGDGFEAQIHTVAFAVTICAQQGIIPREGAMMLLRNLARQIDALKRGGGAGLIILPGD